MINLKDDLKLLNEIAKHTVDVDWDSESIIYIIVDFEKAKNLIRKFLEGNKNYTYEEYLKDYLEDDTIDICGLWGELDQTYKIDTWFNMKRNEFYIVKLHHRVNNYFKIKKRQIKYKIEDVRRKFHYYKLDKKYKKDQKKRLKDLAKIYKNQQI